MAYSLSNKCANNLCKRTVLLQLIIENVVTCFLEHNVERNPTVTKCYFDLMRRVRVRGTVGLVGSRLGMVGLGLWFGLVGFRSSVISF